MPVSVDRETFVSPLTFDALEREVRRLASLDPRLRVCTLAYSICGRRIPYLLYGGGRRTVLYVACHHAMEWLTGSLLLAFAAELLASDPDPDTRYLIVPMLNPDGVELALRGPDPRHPLYARQLRMNGGSADFSHWQANARGVDLNHNYSVGFSAYARLEAERGIDGGAPSLFAGLYPESEPETAALAGLVRLLRPLIILTLHTQGEEIYYARAEATPSMHRMAAELERLTGYVAADATGTAAYGGLTEWAVRCGLPCFTLECGKGRNPLPPADLPALYERLRPALFAAPSVSRL